MLLLLQCGDIHPNPGPTFENKSIRLCHINVQSLYLRLGNHRRKIDEIESLLINDEKMDIICVSETWLDNTITEDMVKIQGYEYLRKDRMANRAGGAGIYITDAIPFRRALELEFPNTDLLWVEFRLGLKKILVAACYRPPGQSADEVDLFMSNFSDSVEMALGLNPESIFILGDLNDSTPKWDSDHHGSELKLKLYDFINSHDLHQLILEPTYILPNSANILDLLITDSPGYILNQNQGVLPPIGSHHQAIFAEIKVQYKRDKTFLREIWNYNQGDYPSLVTALSETPWGLGQDLFEDMDDIAMYWQNTFLDICKVHIPNRIIKIRPKDKPWMTKQVKKALTFRNRLYKRFKRTRQQRHYDDWKRSAKEANYQMSQAKLAHKEKLRKTLMNTSCGEKHYWKIAKQVYGNKKVMGVPSLMVGNEMVSTSSEKAKQFSKYFAEQQTLPEIPFNHRLPPITFITDQRLSSIKTTPLEVSKILKSLKLGKANGPDGISNRLLKETSDAISAPLSILFNKSFDLAKVPQAWKKANICPIHKKDERSLVTNYRPISLLSCVGKVQERIVYTYLYKYFKANDLLTWKNSGFKELDSAIYQLVYITDKIYRALEAGKEVTMVFLDVSKAFDRVWHSGLLHKLRCLGIEGTLFDWLCDYLRDRKIRAVINGQSDEWLDTTAGVPQGSILGPLLFLVFINDITANIECDIHLFADDTSLMEIIEQHQQSYAKINRDLNRLSRWASKWLVTFNATKTVYLQVSRKLNPAPKPILMLNGTQVKEVPTHKHLGLTFNSTLSWSDHIGALTTKANKCVGLLRRISRDVPRKCLEILYKAMIRPILEYAGVIFDGCADNQLDRLETVQRQAALSCTGAYRHTSHEKLLEELGWPLLLTRRKQHRMNLMFKIQHNLIPRYLVDICPQLTRDRTTYNLRTGMNITTPLQKTTTYQKSFFPQSINDWNNLGPNLRGLNTIDSFKYHQKKLCGSKPNPLYHHNSSKAAINQTRIRLGLSGLSSQRFDYNHINDPRCLTCGAENEDPVHYFMLCRTYDGPRPKFLTDICDILTASDIEIDFRKRLFRNFFIETIIKGTNLLNEDANAKIFQITQHFIKESKRFR
jgi:hypothetical protein